MQPVSVSYKFRETVGAPAFAPYAVMNEEQAIGIILIFHGEQPAVIRTPESPLPVGVEEIAFGDVRTGIRNQLAYFVHRAPDGPRVPARCFCVRFVARDARIGGWPL